MGEYLGLLTTVGLKKGGAMEMDDGDSSTTLWTYLISLNYTIKMIKIVNSTCILPQ